MKEDNVLLLVKIDHCSVSVVLIIYILSAVLLACVASRPVIG